MTSFAEQVATEEAMSFADLVQMEDQSRRQAEEDKRRAEWEKKEADRPWLLRKAGELDRGIHRGLERTATGLNDLAGDAFERLSGGRTRGGRWPDATPEWFARPGSEIFPDRTSVSSMVPYSSGSLTETGGEVGGSMVFPGAGPSRTIGGAILKNALSGGAYGAVTSEDEGLGRVVDAGQAALMAGGAGGTLHGLTSGIGKPSAAADTLEKTIQKRLGSERISSRLPLAQKLSDEDAGSRWLARRARKRNKGVRASVAEDMSQRFNDDVYRMRLRDAFGDDSPATMAGEEVFRKTRDTRLARKAAKKAEKMGLAGMAEDTGSAEARKLLRKTMKLQRQKSERFSHKTANEAGDTATASLMRPLIKEQTHWRQPKMPGGGPPSRTRTALETLGGGGTLAAGVVTGNAPVAAIGGALMGDAGRNLRNLRRAGKAAKMIERGKFVTNVANLPKIKAEPEMMKALYGNAKAQKKLQQWIAENKTNAEIEDLLYKYLRTVQGDQSEDAE